MAKLMVYRQTAHLLLSAPDVLEGETGWSGAHWQPKADVCWSQDEVCIQMEIAGLQAANLQRLVHFEPGRLLIEGRREKLQRPCQARCQQIEIETGAFRRVLSLPPDADGAGITAEYENGLLTIHVPRRASAPAHNVRVAVE
jgi:HSP20 family protein